MRNTFGVAGRGKFYDETGAIRDVVQNHLFQVLAFLAMESPTSLYVDSLRDEVVKVFRVIPPITSKNLVRGQFKGYRQEPGVAPNSEVETFAALRLELDNWRWAGVPFLIRAGKCLPVTTTEVMVKLRRSPLSRGPANERNYFRFRLEPGMGISLGARVKKPAMALTSMQIELTAVEDQPGDEVGAYERLLTDAMKGDALLFVREDAVEAAWEIVEPILGNVGTVEIYDPGTWGPNADALAKDVGGWHNPQ